MPDITLPDAFAEIALLLLLAALAGALAVRLKQPVLIAYIVLGIAVGPAGFSLVQASAEIHLLSQVGVAVLLFVVGLKLDLHQIRHIGAVAVATGLGQLTFTILFGFGLVLLLGNHELMNMQGKVHYVHKAELAAEGGAGAWKRRMQPTVGDLGAALLRHDAAAVRGGGACRTLFVHAGVRLSVAERFGSVERLNEAVRAQIAARGDGDLP